MTAIHEANMQRFNDILQGYVKIKKSPKDYFNAEERLTQAKLAMESFDKDLDDTIKKFNEADMKDFEVSLRMMKREGVKKMSGFNFDIDQIASNSLNVKDKTTAIIQATPAGDSQKVSFLAQLTPEQQTGIRAKAPQLVDNFLANQNALLDFGKGSSRRSQRDGQSHFVRTEED